MGIGRAGYVAETNEILTLGQLYRDRADCENVFDELKNQWGWGGFTTQDLHRCRLLAGTVTLVYNWWNLFTGGERGIVSSARPCDTSCTDANFSRRCASLRLETNL